MVEAEFGDVTLLRNTCRLGFSANHNQVIKPVLDDCLARYVLILNEDTELFPGAVEEMVRWADARPSVGIVGPVIVGTHGARQPSAFPPPCIRSHVGRMLLPSLPPPTATSGFWLNGSCLLVRAEALRQVGSLDERFFIFFEDTDLCVRFLRRGWDSKVCESAQIMHHGHQTVAQPELGSTMERQMVRSAYLYFDKHRGPTVAELVLWLVRGALLARALGALLESVGRSRRSRRSDARLLVALASFDPRRPLPHEAHATIGAVAQP
jgi:hypothetical protein